MTIVSVITKLLDVFEFIIGSLYIHTYIHMDNNIRKQLINLLYIKNL